MTSQRHIERPKVERALSIRPLKQEASCMRVTSIDATEEGVGFASMVPIKTGSAIAVDNPDLSKNMLLLCNVMHCTLIKGGKFHIGVKVEQSHQGNLTTTRIPAEWWNAN